MSINFHASAINYVFTMNILHPLYVMVGERMVCLGRRSLTESGVSSEWLGNIGLKGGRLGLFALFINISTKNCLPIYWLSKPARSRRQC